METLPSVNSVEEILEEEAILRERPAKEAGFALPQIRSAPAGPAPAQAGIVNPVARRCEGVNLSRLAEIAWWEGHFPQMFDTAPLIVQCCQVIEWEMTRIVADPSRQLGAGLLRALEGYAKPGQMQIAVRWLEKDVPTTMGTLEIILFALRKGKEQGLSEVENFLGATFRPGYTELLATNGPGRALARIREEYRNVAAHGKRKLPRSDYGVFCDLAVARASFGSWARSRNLPVPADDRGLLHHHLNHLPGESEAAPEGAALSSLVTPPGSRISVLVEAEPASPARLRSIAVTPRREKAGLRVGDTVRFAVSVNKSCWITLLALSDDGGASVLLPNDRRPYGRQPAGTLYAPAQSEPECEFPLEGPPGPQWVCVLATSDPLPGALVLPTNGAMMRRLNAAEADELAAAFSSTAAEGRSVGWCEFEVGG
jgi:hypothetical protein